MEGLGTLLVVPMLGVGVRVFHDVDATRRNRIQVHDPALAIVCVASTGLGVPYTPPCW